ncbi:NAD-dependent epimerase/dehydratase family protein [Fusibacter sp. JL216-2]|uniref:NAD-dependent epimerase/dehydratase family protein n=1 Tax=Fusibacter sp. JL216-2 TaxID=3071453 RepID=UPI003D357A3A
MKTLVMGGTQFVSQEIAKYFIARGHQVSIFTRGKRPVNYKGVHKHYIGDRSSNKDIKQISKDEFDYVIDISAYEPSDVSILLQNLKTTCLKRYLFCSTGGVYVPSQNILSEESPKGENILVGNYGVNKYQTEQVLYYERLKKDLPITIIRPTYIYGPGNNLYREAYFFDALLNGKKIPLPNSHSRIQFIYIEDLLKFVESALASQKAIGKVYNITHPKTYSFKEIVLQHGKLLSSKASFEIVNTSKVDVIKYFPYLDMHYELSINQLIEDKLYIPKCDLEDGLKEAFEWYISNDNSEYESRKIAIEKEVQLLLKA